MGRAFDHWRWGSLTTILTLLNAGADLLCGLDPIRAQQAVCQVHGLQCSEI